MKRLHIQLIGLLAITTMAVSCQKGDLQSNPNVASENSTIPASLLLNRLTWELYQGGGVVDKISNNVFEGPWNQLQRWNQFTVSTNSYYRGQNSYNFSNTATTYGVLKYAVKMEGQAKSQFGTDNTIYGALGKFFRAYCFVWLTQRVGDIPMTEAGSGELTPAFDTQHDVFKNSLKLLDDANTMLASIITSANSSTVVDGDIYGLTYLQWQKVINTYKLRVLVSLSHPAAANSDLNIQQQFATIVNNPTTYPVMTGNSDNLAFKFTSVNQYPYNPSEPYNLFENIGKVYLDITTANQDPRTFAAATPAPAQIAAGKTVSDFTAYAGSDISLTQAQLSANDATGMYSYVNYKRYFASYTGPETYIVLGYPEMCFNIAEAINRGWLSGDAGTWYTNGIKASLSIYGLTDGQTYTVGNREGTTLGTTTISVTNFLNNANVVYKGNNADGLKQILEQKYVAFFENSGWEAFYNWRRTGIPALISTGAGINPAGVIPKRWLYPVDEKNNNGDNLSKSLSTQYSGTDDVNKLMWMLQ